MLERRLVRVWGAVQGVGFRPFAANLARELGLAGWVLNSPEGAELEIQGPPEAIGEFIRRLAADLPSPGFIAGTESSPAAVIEGAEGFSIQPSRQTGERSALILPDIAPCARCLQEIRDPGNRRHGYPFANCTHCGPRSSIIRRLPYDRPNTAMAGFALCPACQAEYDDPEDRRYHAQPTACPVCGPSLTLASPEGESLDEGRDALLRAADLIRAGKIVAVKGVGGFHLMVDARNSLGVRALRERKRREAKPLAVMVPSLEAAPALAVLNHLEEEALASPAAPILIALAKPETGLAAEVAPVSPNLGLMLPSSPLHALLMDELGFAVVATSGNLSDEPICIDNEEALKRLGGIADAFLLHNRPIVRPIDDSVCRMLGASTAVLRRARGFAPLPFALPGAQPGLVAYGSHFKGSAAISGSGRAVVGQHVGDLDNLMARRRLEEEVEDLCALQETAPAAALHDLHPDLASTLAAQASGLPCQGIQHHLAHAAALIGERDIHGPVLIAAWDGTGLGPDGTIWGGELLLVDGAKARRVGSLRPFLLPGGDAASRQGFRAALGALYAAGGLEAATAQEGIHPLAPAVVRLLRAGPCPITTSMGRLFDAAAALGLGVLASRFEGDAAMQWEAAADPAIEDAYPLPVVRNGNQLILDWAPTLFALMADDAPPGARSARFHRALALALADAAAQLGVEQVGLTGGCFQNRLLSRLCAEALLAQGMAVWEHQRIPPNDGGIAFGQLVAAVKGMFLKLD